MALVESLLTAMVRADGDALVMHVGERPYVVVGAGTLDLSTQVLNLDAMTGMLQQLLPAAAQGSLEEFGAVEHRLPPHQDDAFTVVAARGGNDIWIEIRRRRHVVAAAVAPVGEEVVTFEPVVVDQPRVEVEAAVEAEALVADEAFVILADETPAAADEMPTLVDELPSLVEEAAPVVEATAPVQAEKLTESLEDLLGPGEADVPIVAAEAATPIEEPMLAEQPVLAEAPIVAEEPILAEGPIVVEDPIAIEQPILAEEPILAAEPIVIEEPMLVEEIAAADVSAVTDELTAAPVASEAPAPVVSEPEREPELAVPAASTITERAPVLQMTRTVRMEVPPRATTVRGSGVERLLRLAASRAASALFVISDSPPAIRVEGDIRPLDGEAVMTRADVESAVMEIVPEAAQESVGRGEATEWITDFADLGRVRCLTFTDHRGPGVVFRMIATRAATAEQLGLSREVQALATEPQGLVLVAGLPGSGKSTLVSALVDLVNRQRAEYVVTLERQIRLVHEHRTALVSQREVRGGADEALIAARAALREDPDVLVVDDLVSAPMVPLLLEAATEGLVFVSLTAPTTIDAVERFVDLAPADKRAGVRAAMAETFRGAVGQVLLKKSGGGVVAAREVLLATAAVTRVISDGASGQLQAALEGGRKHGMVPLTDALVGLVHSGVVDVREAFRKSPDRNRLLTGLKREGVDTSVVERLA